MHCPACSTEVPPDNLFCEECGAALAAPQPGQATCACGASLTDCDEEGFCLRCGRKQRLPLPTDHMEEALFTDFAAVTDRGLRHDRNEDRFGIDATAAAQVMVVCDGVSSSSRSELAATAVSEGVLQFVREALSQGAPHDCSEVLRQAFIAGSSLLEANLRTETRRISGSRKLRKPDDNPPSTTVVAAVVADGVVTVGWMGDSRAYWIEEQTAWPLTRDHSWQNDVVSAGEMTAEQAAKAPNAHAITRWIGSDAADFEAEIISRPLTGPGTLLLCTDGLWNYAATPEQMAALVRSSKAPGTSSNDALTLAQNLVAFALARGGHDNVTVAVLRVDAGNTVRTREQDGNHGG